MEYLSLVSIMIATFNSERLLPRTLDAIKKQTYPKELIEILIVDGGSTDNTIEIAKQYGCKILNNDKTEPVNAKLIGARNAIGKYLITLDHDEVMSDKRSIEKKVLAAQEHTTCKVFLPSGYLRPRDYPKLNQYISEFGDPFSLFIYKFSKDSKFFIKDISKCGVLVDDTRDYSVFLFDDTKHDVILELYCLGTMIDREYFKQIPNIFESRAVYSHSFFEMLGRGEREVAIMKNDPIVHYSVDSIKAYLPKLKWRVKNNIHYSDMGDGGFDGRLKYQRGVNIRKYAFIPYTFFCVAPLLDGIYLAVTRKNTIYLLHIIFCWYVLIQIVFQYSLKIFKRTPQKTSYDGKKKI